MKITLSFLIPIYNVEKFLPKCLSSILNQNEPRCKYEIIMFDNQSKDNTFEIAKDFQSQYPDIVKAFQNPVNRGPAFALNRCWEKSKHEYIFVLHSDNELIDGSLSLLIDYISSESYQQGIVFGDIEYIDSSNNVFGSWSGKHLGQGHLSNANLIKNYI